MKKHLKKVGIGLTLAAAVFVAQAQYLVTPVSSWTEAASGTSTSNSTTVVIDCSAQRNVAVQWTFNLGGAGTSINGLRFVPSLDPSLPASTTVDLSQGYVMAQAANGATAITIKTNWDTLGYRYLILAFSTNGNAQISTNTLSYVVTKGASAK